MLGKTGRENFLSVFFSAFGSIRAEEPYTYVCVVHTLIYTLQEDYMRMYVRVGLFPS